MGANELETKAQEKARTLAEDFNFIFKYAAAVDNSNNRGSFAVEIALSDLKYKVDQIANDADAKSIEDYALLQEALSTLSAAEYDDAYKVAHALAAVAPRHKIYYPPNPWVQTPG